MYGAATDLITYLLVSFLSLFLFQPLGFKVDDTKLKRAGLDYWPYPMMHYEHDYIALIYS